MSYPWGHNRRFNAYSNWMKQTYGLRIQKISLDAGFTCPNRDGSVAYGGCTYCNNDSFTPSYCDPSKPISQQIDEGIRFLRKRYKTDHFWAYFQAYSNTYAPLPTLVDLYEQATAHPQVSGLVIGTRPDCIDTAKLDYFADLNRRIPVTLEFGIESVYNDTLERINRGHTFEQTEWAINESAKRGIKTGSHYIFGLPGEDRERQLASVDIINRLPLHSIKLHQLHIVKKTVMAKQYKDDPDQFDLFTLDDYTEFIIDYLERLRPDIRIQRLYGEAPPYMMAGPKWTDVRNYDVIEHIEKRMAERDSWQGKQAEYSPV